MAKGNFIEYVISDDPNKYPNESEQDGYYYRKVTKVETEEQIVTAGTTPIEVVPSAGKLISKVNINPTPTEEKTVTPTTEDLIVTPVEGKQLSQVTVQGDANLISENIKSGVDIFGVSGNYEGSGQYAWKKTEKTTVSSSVTVQITTDGNTSISGRYWGNGKSTSEIIAEDLDRITIPVSDFAPDSIYAKSMELRIMYGSFLSGGVTYPLAFWFAPIANTNWDPSTAGVRATISNGNINFTSGSLLTSFEGTTGTASKTKSLGTTTTNVFKDFVVSDNNSTYPSNGKHTDGYYYSSISQ